VDTLVDVATRIGDWYTAGMVLIPLTCLGYAVRAAARSPGPYTMPVSMTSIVVIRFAGSHGPANPGGPAHG
jgi:hypothetical protein